MIRGGIFVAAALVAWLTAYASGAWPWLGYAWMSRSSFGAGPVSIIGESRAGTSLGLDDFLFFEGQEVMIEYDADIRSGSLWFHVFQPWDGRLGDGVSHYVSESGSGTWTMSVPATGVYHVTIEPSPLHGRGQGWDLSYSAKWGARPAGSR
jgi:hypothetical protein